ncbi:hypothetical protein DITRI_Ditri12bG0064000 [Diplodiscus trichospermus]
MNQQQCVKALAKYASISPCITVTVWRELQKENRDFFQAYFHALSPYRPFMGKTSTSDVGIFQGNRDLNGSNSQVKEHRLLQENVSNSRNSKLTYAMHPIRVLKIRALRVLEVSQKKLCISILN